MNHYSLAVVIALAEGWTRLYTCGLPPDLREDRRAEIASDLWEHQHDAEVKQESATRAALEILIRLVAGMPADCAWRLESGAGTRTKKRSMAMHTTSRTMQILTITACIIVIGLMGASGIGITLRGWQHDTDLSWMLTGAIPLLIGMPAILTGVLTAPSHPVRAITLVMVGVLITVVVWFWVFMITIPLGIGLIALSYQRAKRGGWNRSRKPA